MKLKIFKYKLEIVPRQTIEVTEGAEILSVHPQNDGLYVWAEVSTELPTEKREIIIITTGEDVNPCEGKRFLGTVLLANGNYVIHVFEKM